MQAEGLLCKTHPWIVQQQQKKVFYIELGEQVSVMNLTVVVIHQEPYSQSKSFIWTASNDADTHNYLDPLFKIATVCICLLRQERK
jgi:hypothetical protein